MLLEAGQELQAWLPLDEKAYQRVAGPAHADARAYFAYSATQLVLATSASILRWLELLEKMEEDGQESASFWTESILDEQNGRIRKLAEALMDLICFRDTNEDGYFRHLLLLRELNRARGTQNDLRDFYACPNRNIQAQVERAANEISELEASGALELERCWYKRGAANPSSATSLAVAAPGQLIASARSRLMKALGAAEGHEKLALGMSYDRLYSRTSGYIHFEPEGRPDGGAAAVSRALDECGILGLNVVVALQYLLGEASGEWNEKVWELLRDNPYPAELAELRTRGVAEVGDFVLAYGDLAEVLDTAESDFGYRSYKVLYISASPMPGIDEDWFPAQFLRVMWSGTGPGAGGGRRGRSRNGATRAR